MTRLKLEEHKDTTDPFNQYQEWALSKMGGPVDSMPNGPLLLGAIGLTGEAGEYADSVKKVVFHEHELTGEQRLIMANELGDVLWYLAIAAESIGFTLAYIADRNQMKLNQRYPDGFDSQRSINRVDDTIAALTEQKLNIINQQLKRTMDDDEK